MKPSAGSSIHRAGQLLRGLAVMATMSIATAHAQLPGEIRDTVMARYGGAGFDPARWSDGLSPEQRADGDALLASLRDPAVRRLEADEARTFLDQMGSTVAPGIGLIELLCIDLAEDDGRLTVITPVPGTPAAESDVRTGDVIVAINGRATATLSLHRAAQALLGEAGSEVALVLERDGRTLQKTLRRAPFPAQLPLVSSRIVVVDGLRIGHVGILRFDPGVAAQAGSAIATLQEQDVAALVLDLRNNPCGALPEAIAVAGLFLGDGTPVAGLDARGDIVRTFRSEGDAMYVGPLAVLQNAGSASAAEVVAGALRAAGRAQVVGERSFGKGLAHAMERLSDGSGLMLPIGRLVTPDGIDILAQGIAPDVERVDAGVPVVHGGVAGEADAVFHAGVRSAVSTRRPEA
jgi:carboxyl-terminal processing protease